MLRQKPAFEKKLTTAGISKQYYEPSKLLLVL